MSFWNHQSSAYCVVYKRFIIILWYQSTNSLSITSHITWAYVSSIFLYVNQITRDGRVVSETTYRMYWTRREQQQQMHEILANAILNKTLDMERTRQAEIRKKIDEISKIELVRRMKVSFFIGLHWLCLVHGHVQEFWKRKATWTAWDLLTLVASVIAFTTVWCSQLAPPRYMYCLWIRHSPWVHRIQLSLALKYLIMLSTCDFECSIYEKKELFLLSRRLTRK